MNASLYIELAKSLLPSDGHVEYVHLGAKLRVSIGFVKVGIAYGIDWHPRSPHVGFDMHTGEVNPVEFSVILMWKKKPELK